MQIDYMQVASYFIAVILLASYSSLSHREKSKLPRIPVGLFILFFLFKTMIPVFNYVGLYSNAQTFNIAAVIALWMAIVRAGTYIVIDWFLRAKREMNIPTITRDFALAICYIIIAMIVLKNKTNINLGSLLTTSAILTAVIGFAMQDTLGNLFSGLALQMEHPYQIGDWIGFEGIEGRVVGITWKSTKILTRAEEMVFVPNNTIAKSRLTNFSRPSPRHISSIEIGASYNDPPHKVRKAVIEVIKNHPAILKSFEPAVRVIKYDSFSINYRAVFAVDDFANEGKIKCDILNDIWYKFRRHGIKIPYPMQEQMDISVIEQREMKRLSRAKDEAEIEDTISKIDLFSKLGAEVRKDLTGRIAVLEYAEGEAIVHQGGPPGPMFIIKEGECAVLASGEAGGSVEVARLKAMQFFGEMSVLTGQPRTATVKATKDTTCYEVEKEDLIAIFSNNTEALSKVSEVLTERQIALEKHKTKLSADAITKAEQEKQLVNKIKSFLGL